MVFEIKNAVGFPMPRTLIKSPISKMAVITRFAAWVNSHDLLDQVSLALQARLFEQVISIARLLDVSHEAGSASGYVRHILYEDPNRWSLAAIVLRPEQQIHPHDHGGWGCAVTVQGIEGDRRYEYDPLCNLVLCGERHYKPGTGYLFDAMDIHQPVGADPRRVTVALHFLAHGIYKEEGGKPCK